MAKKQIIRISIIVPAYNEEKHIGKTLQSILRQTYRNFEIIVVDNNSTDKTNFIARKYTKKVFLEKKRGYHVAVSRGVRESKGSIIAVADSDTTYPKNWLKQIIKEFGKNKNVVGVYGTGKLNDHHPIMNMISEPVTSIFQKYSKMIGHDNTIGFNFAIKKEAYIKCGGYDPEIYNDIGLDLELGRRIQKIGELRLNTSIKAYTSSRRLKKEGTLKYLYKFLLVWYRFNKNKKQKHSYETYNKTYR